MEEESLIKNAKFWRFSIKLVLLVIFLIAFWPEIGASVSFLWFMLANIIGHFPALIFDLGLRQNISDEIAKAFTPEVVSSLSLLLSIVILYLVLFLVSIFLTAQFVLPIQNNQDRWPAAKRLFFYWVKFHGAALFIKEGQRIERPGESESLEPGVVLVDMNSAIAIEQQPFPGKESKGKRKRRSILDVRAGVVRVSKALFKKEKRPILDIRAWVVWILKTFFKKKTTPIVRAAGPGLVFTEYGERITGEVDLRKQFRVLPGVQAYTRDGIKVTTLIIAVFTLGETEETVYVTYIGDVKNADNLRFIQLNPDPDKQKHPNKKIIKFYEMDRDEREEIHRMRLKPISPPVQTTYYHFDPERVSAAIYARFYNVDGKDIQHWTDLPLKVATETFRNSVARVTYDDLYSPESSNASLKEFKANLARAIRHQGVMSYKFVKHNNTGEFLKEDMVWDETKLHIEPERPLPGSRLLRDYGIKIIHATFGELKPDQDIRKKLMETWMAQWEKEIETIKAESDLKAVRIKDNARAQAQLDMTSNLSSLFKTAADSPQAMALRVFQALETAATDPSTSQVLPRNVFNMLQNLHSWLLKEHKKKDEHHPHHNEIDHPTDEKPDDL